MATLRGMIFVSLLAAMLGASAAQAADDAVTVAPSPHPRTVVIPPGPAEVVAPPPATAVVVPPAVAIPDKVVVTGGPVIGPSLVPYGCRRVWRCDAQVCEWRRACNGIYGYVEGPYYSKPLAVRQWARDYLPGPGTETSGGTVHPRKRVVEPALK